MNGIAPLLLGFAALAAGTPAAGRDAADLVLRNGTLYPVSAPGGIAGSVAIRKGRIAYVGADAGVADQIGPATEIVDLRGRAVTPGLIDAHAHLEGLGAALEQVDLRGATSYAEVVQRVAGAAATLPRGTWLWGRGWDQNLWPEPVFPTHHALSAAVPDHPVVLRRIDGHALLANAAAMRAAGVEANRPDPPGGRVERDASGAPTGVFVDNAMELVDAKQPPLSAQDRRRRLRRAADTVAALGLTTVTDMGIGPDTLAAYRALHRAGELPIRAVLFWSGDDRRIDRRLADKPWTSTDARLALRGVKLYADGALGSRGAALLEPYADAPGNLGLVITPTAELVRVARLAQRRGWQVAVHAIGDRGNLLALDALEQVFDGAAQPDRRWRIEHVQVVRAQDLARMARLGIVASMQPTHATSDMPWAPARLGPARLPRAYAWRAALQAGVRLAFGSDFPVEDPAPMLGLYAAVTRQDPAGHPAGGWLPDQRLTRDEALRAFTLDAAWSLFLEKEVGSIEVGKRADLVVFERDPMTVPVAELPRVRVDLTLVDGRIVHRAKEAP